jgi:hypothetical protein
LDTKTAERPDAFAKIGKKAAAALADQLEERSRDYLRHCSETIPASDRDTTWSRLYAATHRLRLAVLSLGANNIAVADAVLEIGSNLMGCEEIAVVELDPDHKSITILTSVGITAEQRHALNTHAAKFSAEVSRGQVCLVDKKNAADQFLASLGITALVPLSPSQSVEGAIVFFNLLSHRHGFDSVDRELLGLLSIYVGPCLFGQ